MTHPVGSFGHSASINSNISETQPPKFQQKVRSNPFIREKLPLKQLQSSDVYFSSQSTRAKIDRLLDTPDAGHLMFNYAESLPGNSVLPSAVVATPGKRYKALILEKNQSHIEYDAPPLSLNTFNPLPIGFNASKGNVKSNSNSNSNTSPSSLQAEWVSYELITQPMLLLQALQLPFEKLKTRLGEEFRLAFAPKTGAVYTLSDEGFHSPQTQNNSQSDAPVQQNVQAIGSPLPANQSALGGGSVSSQSASSEIHPKTNPKAHGPSSSLHGLLEETESLLSQPASGAKFPIQSSDFIQSFDVKHQSEGMNLQHPLREIQRPFLAKIHGWLKNVLPGGRLGPLVLGEDGKISLFDRWHFNPVHYWVDHEGHRVEFYQIGRLPNGVLANIVEKKPLGQFSFQETAVKKDLKDKILEALTEAEAQGLHLVQDSVVAHPTQTTPKEWSETSAALAPTSQNSTLSPQETLSSSSSPLGAVDFGFSVQMGKEGGRGASNPFKLPVPGQSSFTPKFQPHPPISTASPLHAP
jgi:hypothetical protein